MRIWQSIQAFAVGLAVSWSRHAIEQRARRMAAQAGVKAVHAGLGLLILQSVMVSGFLMANGGLIRLIFADGLPQVAQGVVLMLLGGLYFVVPPVVIWLWGGRLSTWQARLRVDPGSTSPRP